MSSAVLGYDSCMLGEDKTSPFQAFHIFANSIVAHFRRFAYGRIAWVALVGASVLAEHKVKIQGYLAR